MLAYVDKDIMNKTVSAKNVNQVAQDVQVQIHAVNVQSVQLLVLMVHVLVQQAFTSLLIQLDSVKDVILTVWDVLLELVAIYVYQDSQLQQMVNVSAQEVTTLNQTLFNVSHVLETAQFAKAKKFVLFVPRDSIFNLELVSEDVMLDSTFLV